MWEEEGSFLRGLYSKAGEAGLLGLGFPEEYGGAGGGLVFYRQPPALLVNGLTGHGMT